MSREIENMNIQSIQNEIWRDVVGYEGLYQISNLGRLKHLATPRKKGTGKYERDEHFCTSHVQNNGYLVVDLYKDNKRKTFLVHRLVAMSFLLNPQNYEFINHIDNNRKNNCLSNLEWCTKSYNTKYSYDTNDRRKKMNWKSGKDNANSKAVLMSDMNGKVIKRYECIMDTERELGIWSSCIVSCLKGRTKTAGGYKWNYVK